jgi:hypothetical protein
VVRRALVPAFFSSILFFACNNEPQGTPPPRPPFVPPADAFVYNECSTICLRPSDCAVAYSSGDICPPGFLCALRFSCTPDGGRD